MTKNDAPSALAEIIKAIEMALDFCDDHGFSLAAVDLNSALEKLKDIERSAQN